MKKYICLFLAAVVLLTVVPLSSQAASAQSRYYSDVYTSDSYYDAAMYLFEHDIMQGTSAVTSTSKGKFSPGATLTRGQVVTILWRMLNKPEPSGAVTAFTDCSSSSYYYDAVRWASSSNVGLANGYSDGTFKPGNPVTNQEELTFLYRFACYCTYASDTTTAQNSYISIFNNSDLTNKISFKSYAKPAVGWAYYNGFITDKDLDGCGACTRSTTAENAYGLYKKYQKKYGLSVVNTKNMSYVEDCGVAMQTLFKHYGASNTLYKKNLLQGQFVDAMESAFSAAKPLDICYLYCASHGDEGGLLLFNSASPRLTPEFLRNQIDNYKGTFVVFISGCHTGTYVSTGIHDQAPMATDNMTNTRVGDQINSAEDADSFDPYSFVALLVDPDSNGSLPEGSDLRFGQRIKVLCSSRKDEVSYDTSRYATKFWCLGSGYDLQNKVFTSLYADSNNDTRVSLYELYNYSYHEVCADFPEQHIVGYPYPDTFIIFEDSY